MKSRCDKCDCHFKILYTGQAVTLVAIIATFLFSYYNNEQNRNALQQYIAERTFTEQVFEAANRQRRTSDDEKYKYFFEPTDSEKDELFEPKGDWILLPSYARVSIQALTKFCVSSDKFCKTQHPEVNQVNGVNEVVPQGLRGPPGPPGPPGKCECDTISVSELDKEDKNETFRESTSEKLPNDGASANSHKVSNSTGSSNHVANLTALNILVLATSSVSTLYQYDLNTTSSPPTSTSKTTKSNKRKPKKKSNRTRFKPIFGQRERKCVLKRIGPAKEISYRKNYFGAWMRDPLPHPADATSYWVTDHFSGNLLLEFGTLEQLKSARPSKTHQLPEMFDGTNHIVYNGSLYYHRTGTNHIVKYDIRSKVSIQKSIPKAAYKGSAYIYGPLSSSMSYMDFSTDENGLWVIYRKKNRGYLMLAKLNSDTLAVIAEVRFHSIKSRKLQNAFIACGTMYTVESTAKKAATIGWAHDLYAGRMVYVNMTIQLPEGQMRMMEYSSRDHKVYIFDNGKLLVMPVIMTNLPTLNETSKENQLFYI